MKKKFIIMNLNNIENVLRSLNEEIIKKNKNFIFVFETNDYTTCNVVHNGHVTFLTSSLPSICLGRYKKYESFKDLDIYADITATNNWLFRSLKIMEFEDYDDLIRVHRDKDIALYQASEFYEKQRKILENVIIK